MSVHVVFKVSVPRLRRSSEDSKKKGGGSFTSHALEARCLQHISISKFEAVEKLVVVLTVGNSDDLAIYLREPSQP